MAEKEEHLQHLLNETPYAIPGGLCSTPYIISRTQLDTTKENELSDSGTENKIKEEGKYDPDGVGTKFLEAYHKLWHNNRTSAENQLLLWQQREVVSVAEVKKFISENEKEEKLENQLVCCKCEEIESLDHFFS